MHDLRHDPDAYNTHIIVDPQTVSIINGARLDGVTQVLPVEALRTVAMPDLRTPQARALDAQARGLDCRTGDDKLVAELVRIVDVVQALVLRVELLEGGTEATEQAWEIAKLRYYIEALELMLSPEQRALAVTNASAALEQHDPPAWVAKWGRQ